MSNTSKVSLWKRRGVYYIGYFDALGKKRWKSTKCTIQGDALRALTNFKKLLDEKPPTQSLAQFTDDFLSFARATYAKATVDISTIGLRHLQRIACNCPLTELTLEHLDRYKADRLKGHGDKRGPVSAVTVNIELRHLRAAMSVAVRWKLLPSNPFSGVRLLRIPEKAPAFLSYSEFRALLAAAAADWFREILIVAVSTGLRRGELLNLTWGDVDLDRRLIHVENRGAFVTKTGKRREVPMNGAVYRLLLERAGGGPAEQVFARNGSPIDRWVVTHEFKECVRRAGLSEALHFHSLRHTFASWLVQAGTPIYSVQKLLGHSDIKVTEVYAHLQPETLHATVNKIMLPLN